MQVYTPKSRRAKHALAGGLKRVWLTASSLTRRLARFLNTSASFGTQGCEEELRLEAYPRHPHNPLPGPHHRPPHRSEAAEGRQCQVGKCSRSAGLHSGDHCALQQPGSARAVPEHSNTGLSASTELKHMCLKLSDSKEEQSCVHAAAEKRQPQHSKRRRSAHSAVKCVTLC